MAAVAGVLAGAVAPVTGFGLEPFMTPLQARRLVNPIRSDDLDEGIAGGAQRMARRRRGADRCETTSVRAA